MKDLVYKCQVGSFAYGTNIETSDMDFKGIYIQPDSDILGFKYKPQTDVSKDETYYELKRYLELLQSGNPTVLEMLFMYSEMIIEKHPCLDILFENKEKFLTKHVFNSFCGYAVSQIKRAQGLNKKMNWEKEKTVRKEPIDFCYVISEGKTLSLVEYLQRSKMKQEYCGLKALNHFSNTYALYYDWSAAYGEELNKPVPPIGYRGICFEQSNDVRLSSIPKEQGDQVNCIVSFNKDAYATHCKDYNSYQTWLQERNTDRYVDTSEHNQKIDGKNLMHCVRLLDTGLEIAETNTFSVKRPNAEYLLSIRKGKLNLNAIIEESEQKLERLNTLRDKSSLPENVDQEWIHSLINEIRNKYTNEQ